jgi:hypothetical protein
MFIKDILKDDSSRFSLAKFMLAGGWVLVSLYIVELIVTRTMTTDVLVTYISFVSGHSLVSKGLDKYGERTNPNTPNVDDLVEEHSNERK